MIRDFGTDVDDQILLDHLRREAAEDAYNFLQGLAFSDTAISASLLRAWLDNAV
jgi:hypothetical protein